MTKTTVERLEDVGFSVDSDENERGLDIFLVEGPNDSPVVDSDLQCLAPLQNLTRLSLVQCTKISGDFLRYLKGNESLSILRLIAIRVCDSTARHIPGMPKLQELVLSGTELTDIGLKHIASCQNLRRVRLHSQHFTDKGLLEMVKLTNLESFLIYAPRVTDEAVAKLKQALPRTKVLHLRA